MENSLSENINALTQKKLRLLLRSIVFLYLLMMLFSIDITNQQCEECCTC